MRGPAFATAVTRLLGLRHPILCGGMGPGVSDARYVAAVARAGGLGFVVSAAFEPPALAEELARCHDLAEGHPVGVNLYISRRPGSAERLNAWAEVIVRAGVTVVETAGGDPSDLIPRLKDAGLTVLHKAPSLRFARKAQSLGADAVILLGGEAGGHPGATLTGSLVLAAEAEGLDIPFILAGGIGHGSQIAAALAMGAGAVLMGSRMLVSEELWLHPDYKRRLVESDGSDTRLVLGAIRDTRRILNNETARAIAEIEASGASSIEAFLDHLNGSLARESYLSGDWSRGALDVGQAIRFADRIAPVEAIFDDLMDQAGRAAERLMSVASPQTRLVNDMMS